MTQIIKTRLTFLAYGLFVALGTSACQQTPTSTFGIHEVHYDAMDRKITDPNFDFEQLGPHAFFTDHMGMGIFVKTPAVINESCIDEMKAGMGEFDGKPIINVILTTSCAERFADLTRESVGKQFALLLNGDLVTAPYIRGEITGGSFYIEGDFGTLSETKALVKSFQK